MTILPLGFLDYDAYLSYTIWMCQNGIDRDRLYKTFGEHYSIMLVDEDAIAFKLRFKL